MSNAKKKRSKSSGGKTGSLKGGTIGNLTSQIDSANAAENSNQSISTVTKHPSKNPFLKLGRFIQTNPYWALISVIFFSLIPVAWWFTYDFLPKITSPHFMQGEFNIAIASFVVVDENGREVKSQDGIQVANFLFQRIQTHFDELDFQNIQWEIRSPAETGAIHGNSPDERFRAANKLAQRINAHIIIYGVITDAGENSHLTPEFFVSYTGFQEAGEILGPYALGTPLLVTLPFDSKNAQDIENPALSARANALSLLTIGLAYYSNDDFQTATNYFSRAEDTKGWIDSAGKDVVYILLGNTYVRMASRDKAPGYLSSAQDAYEKALAIDPGYLRASIGQANVLYLDALGDPANPSFDSVDQNKLDAAQALFEAALNNSDPPVGINVSAKSNFGLGQIFLVKAQILQDSWVEQARKEFEAVVQEYEAGNKTIVYYASHSYARLGLIEWQKANVDASAQFYREAINIASPYYKGYYYTRLGELYYANRNIELAIQAYENAISTAEFYGDETSMSDYQQRLNELKLQKP
jgi:tetratricopeptide (TPR) repeat protein